MAGRGRSKTAVSRDQLLQALNVKGNDILPVILEPPPTYPTLLTRPTPFPEGEVYDGQMQCLEDFRRSMLKVRNGEPANNTNINKISYRVDANSCLNNLICGFEHWHRLPEELRSQSSKKRRKIVKNAKTEMDIEKRLEELAEKEQQLNDSDDEDRKQKDSDKEDDDENAEKEAGTDDDFDDDNDYGNNYFDNGESYDDNADEPHDDGPIY